MGLLAWLHRAWLGWSIFVAVVLAFVWIDYHIDRPTKLVDQLCAHQKALVLERNRLEIAKPENLDILIQAMSRLCQTGVPAY